MTTTRTKPGDDEDGPEVVAELEITQIADEEGEEEDDDEPYEGELQVETLVGDEAEGALEYQNIGLTVEVESQDDGALIEVEVKDEETEETLFEEEITFDLEAELEQDYVIDVEGTLYKLELEAEVDSDPDEETEEYVVDASLRELSVDEDVVADAEVSTALDAEAEVEFTASGFEGSLEVGPAEDDGSVTVYRPWILRHSIAIMRPGAACLSGRVGTGLASGVCGARSASFRCRSA